MEIADELVLSTILPDGTNSFSLASRLGQMITEVESLYGQRDQTFTILGVEFFQTGPQLLFPGNPKHVVVRLGQQCLRDPMMAYFQLSQEAVHLLDPPISTNNLEEGVATVFAIKYMKRHFGGIDLTGQFAGQWYDECRRAVEDVSALCPDFVRRLRDQGGGTWKSLSAVTEQDILRVCPQCPVDTAQLLAAGFGLRP